MRKMKNNMKETNKDCPFLYANRFHDSSCCGEKCSFWCEFANRCSIPLLAEMFADSTICQNVFNNAKGKQE